MRLKLLLEDEARGGASACLEVEHLALVLARVRPGRKHELDVMAPTVLVARARRLTATANPKPCDEMRCDARTSTDAAEVTADDFGEAPDRSAPPIARTDEDPSLLAHALVPLLHQATTANAANAQQTGGIVSSITAGPASTREKLETLGVTIKRDNFQLCAYLVFALLAGVLVIGPRRPEPRSGAAAPCRAAQPFFVHARNAFNIADGDGDEHLDAGELVQFDREYVAMVPEHLDSSSSPHLRSTCSSSILRPDGIGEYVKCRFPGHAPK